MTDKLTISNDQCSRLEKHLKKMYANQYQVINVSNTGVSMQIFSSAPNNLFKQFRLWKANIEKYASHDLAGFFMWVLPQKLSELQNMGAIGDMGEGTAPTHANALGSKLLKKDIDGILSYIEDILKKVFETNVPIKYTKAQILHLWEGKSLFADEHMIRLKDHVLLIRKATDEEKY